MTEGTLYMQRPVMNPTFTYDAPKQPKKPPGRFAWVSTIFRLFAKLLMAHPFGNRQFRNEDGSKFSRMFRALTYRLAFVPVLLVGFIVAILFAATHPARSGSGADPLAYGIYYDPANFTAEDGAKLEGWLVPVLDAKKVLMEKDLIVGKRYPAVVLVHDFGGSRQDLLPLVQPLHQAGFVVLSVSLRGTSATSNDAQTFGIREALDVKAAVEMLRQRSYINPSKIALIGVGTGANACVIAASKDPAIAAMIITEPVNGFDQAFVTRIGSDHKWLPPLRSLFRWSFQVMYGVDCGDLDMVNFNKVIADRHVLVSASRRQLMDPSTMRGVRLFLLKHLTDELATAR